MNEQELNEQRFNEQLSNNAESETTPVAADSSTTISTTAAPSKQSDMTANPGQIANPSMDMQPPHSIPQNMSVNQYLGNQPIPSANANFNRMPPTKYPLPGQGQNNTNQAPMNNVAQNPFPQGNPATANPYASNGYQPNPYLTPGPIQSTSHGKPDHFHMFALPSLIYALIYAFCIYDTHSSILDLPWVIATLWYTTVILKYSAKQRGTVFSWTAKKENLFYAGVMILLSISSFLTDTFYIILLNQIGIFLCVLVLLLHNVYDDKKWDFAKYIASIFELAFGSIGYVFSPFQDQKELTRGKRHGDSKKVLYVFVGILVTLPCILIICSILMDADQVFKQLIEDFLENFDIFHFVFRIMWLLLVGFFCSYAISRFLFTQRRTTVSVPKVFHDTTIISIVLTGISLVYLVFCFVQIVYLFLGNATLPEGITYSSYARKGFFQLLVICVLNFITVLLIKKHFPEKLYLKCILLFISICTFIMIASSAYRMILYIGAYDLSTLRIFVLVALLTLTLWMIGVICYLFHTSFPMFHYGALVVCIVYVLFSFSAPDKIIAGYNLSHAESIDDLDRHYISNLSSDAAPYVEEYLREGSSFWEEDPYYCEQCYSRFFENNDLDEESITLFNFNLSRFTAKKIYNNHNWQL